MASDAPSVVKPWALAPIFKSESQSKFSRAVSRVAQANPITANSPAANPRVLWASLPSSARLTRAQHEDQVKRILASNYYEVDSLVLATQFSVREIQSVLNSCSRDTDSASSSQQVFQYLVSNIDQLECFVDQKTLRRLEFLNKLVGSKNKIQLLDELLATPPDEPREHTTRLASFRKEHKKPFTTLEKVFEKGQLDFMFGYYSMKASACSMEELLGTLVEHVRFLRQRLGGKKENIGRFINSVAASSNKVFQIESRCWALKRSFAMREYDQDLSRNQPDVMKSERNIVNQLTGCLTGSPLFSENQLQHIFGERSMSISAVEPKALLDVLLKNKKFLLTAMKVEENPGQSHAKLVDLLQKRPDKIEVVGEFLRSEI